VQQACLDLRHYMLLLVLLVLVLVLLLQALLLTYLCAVPHAQPDLPPAAGLLH
jgi:hypothetical protein